MGCFNGTEVLLETEYTIEFYSFENLTDKITYQYKLKKISELKLEKEYGFTPEKQCQNCNNELILKFIHRNEFSKNTFFYFFIREDCIKKDYNTFANFFPNKSPQLHKIVLISIDTPLSADIQPETIEKFTNKIKENEYNDYIIDLNSIRNFGIQAKNSILTEDSDKNYDEESSYIDEEKDYKLIIDDDLNHERVNYIEQNLFFGQNPKENKCIESLQTEPGEYNKKIKKIYITNCKINEYKYFNDTINLLTKFQGLKYFAFIDNSINRDFNWFDDLCNLFSNNYNIRYIDLRASNISDEYMELLAKSLKDKRIRGLNFAENFITLEGLTELSKFLSINKTLTKLNLERNASCQFKAEGVKIVLNSLIKHSNIKLIDFSFMDLTGCGEFVGNFIKENNSIKSLSFRSCKLNYHDFKNIFRALSNECNLSKIDVSMNDMGGDKSIEEIANCIKVNKSLESIVLEQININMDNYSIIFDAIKENNTIKSYSLSYNNKLKPKIVLNFFLEQQQVTHLDYIPYNHENDEDKGKELTLEEKKIIEKFKTEREGFELIYKINIEDSNT